MGSINRYCTGLEKIVWNISSIDLRTANLLVMKNLDLQLISKLETANRSSVANQGVRPAIKRTEHFEDSYRKRHRR